MSAERPLLVATPLVPPILRGEKRVTRRLIRAMGNRRHIDRLLGDWSLSGKPEPYIGVERPWRPTREPRAGDWLWTVQSDVDDTVCEVIRPPCAVGDVLWVRETWALWRTDTLGEFGGGNEVLDTPWEGRVPLDRQPTETAVLYRERDADEPDEGPWRPSIHMPRWAARIFLRVEDVRVERVQDITEEDAIAEGCDWAAPHWPNPKDVPERDEPNEGPAPSRGERGFARDNFARLWDSLTPDGSKWADNPWVWRIAFKLEVPRG